MKGFHVRRACAGSAELQATCAGAAGATDPAPQLRPGRAPGGFTVIELLIVVVILGTLASLAIPALADARRRAEVARAILDIKAIEQDLYNHRSETGVLPVDLSAVGRGSLLDPWGRPYRYLRLVDESGRIERGSARKDRFLVPLNSDFDLYSVGADGATSGPLSASQSHDDVIRANDGGFVGLGVEF